MVIGERLRALRKEKDLSQGEIANRSGLMVSYLSRVENGHTVPSVETLQKLAGALEVALHQFFYDGQNPTAPSDMGRENMGQDTIWASSGKGARLFGQFRIYLSRMDERDRRLLLGLATKMSRRNSR